MFISYPEIQELYRVPKYSITVNTAARRMTLFRDGKVFKTYPITIGKPIDLIPPNLFKSKRVI
jgi:hypothetical protein